MKISDFKIYDPDRKSPAPIAIILFAFVRAGDSNEAVTVGAECDLGPEVVAMQPTQSAPGSRGTLTLAQPDSPFGITVDAGGHHAFDIAIQVDQLRRSRGAVYVAWAAKPELDEYVQLGTLGDDNHVAATVAWNQFMVFISEEVSADVERWQGPIVLRGLSPSGRLHTMAGHGPFEDVSCQQVY